VELARQDTRAEVGVFAGAFQQGSSVTAVRVSHSQLRSAAADVSELDQREMDSSED